ncbi:glycine receptor subunit alpha-3-like [Limulus polyphemus]|uniref:Glycine receptor subunit alpha-3-like n=1 Tax=Limulus polyphemus TaxID=6850 RepID=A0ABM1SWL5_LIMPO|nr:glycine receptor subunit alpha-3-like [Limulus polyphemus]
MTREILQVYQADIFYHQFWKDHRLNSTATNNYPDNKVILDNRWRSDLWTPDTYFKNSIEGNVHTIINPYSYMVLYNNSEIFFAARMSLSLSCEMNLGSYPHDVQECGIEVMSLQYTTDSVILLWKEFQITNNLLHPQFDFKGHKFTNCTKKYSIGTFSCLAGHFRLSRRFGYFLINKFIPSILIVSTSFLTFWIPADAYPARVTLSVTSLLALVTQQYQSKMPSVSYVIALNIWMMSCIGFVFTTLLEYALVIAFMEHKVSPLRLNVDKVKDANHYSNTKWLVRGVINGSITEPPNDILTRKFKEAIIRLTVFLEFYFLSAS